MPSREAGAQLARKVKAAEPFITSVEQDFESGEWTCYCKKTLIPDYAEVVRIEKLLNSLAELFGGYTDGFGSYGNGGDERSK